MRRAAVRRGGGGRGGRAALVEGRGVSWPGWSERPGAPGVGGRCTPPAVSAPAGAVRARQRLQRLGAPVARCGASGGGRGRRRRLAEEDAALPLPPGGWHGRPRGLETLVLGPRPCPGLAWTPGAAGLEVPGAPAGRAQRAEPESPEGPGAASDGDRLRLPGHRPTFRCALARATLRSAFRMVLGPRMGFDWLSRMENNHEKCLQSVLEKIILMSNCPGFEIFRVLKYL
ncbi:uncharacterized protein RHO17_009278 [Thomomys bottae]